MAFLLFCAAALFRLHPRAAGPILSLQENPCKGGSYLNFISFLQDKQLTVALTGEIDHHCAKEYIQRIAAKIEAYTPEVCVLDFKEVTFMDSSGIAVVINTFRRMAQIEGKLRLTNIGPQPMKVFRTSGVDRIVALEEGVK